MVFKHEWLENPTVVNDGVVVADNNKLKATARGDMSMMISCGDVKVKDVLFVPGLCVNLLSVVQMVKNGNRVIFSSDGCSIFNGCNKLIATASFHNNTFKLDRFSIIG